MSEDLFLSEQHPTSRRWAIFEDNGKSAWLYLSEPNSTQPVATCFVYNRVAAPEGITFSRGEPPIVPAAYVVSQEPYTPPAEGAVSFRWAADGDSVALVFDIEVVGFIANGNPRGFSKQLKAASSFGQSMDDMAIYEQAFGAT